MIFKTRMSKYQNFKFFCEKTKENRFDISNKRSSSELLYPTGRIQWKCDNKQMRRCVVRIAKTSSNIILSFFGVSDANVDTSSRFIGFLCHKKYDGCIFWYSKLSSCSFGHTWNIKKMLWYLFYCNFMLILLFELKLIS